MKLNKYKLLALENPKNNPETEYQQDEWRLDVVGIIPPPYTSSTSIRFHLIKPLWLKQLAKRFIRFHAATKAYYTLLQYMRAIRHFSVFIERYNCKLQSHEINRQVMVKFIEYVHALEGANEVKNKMITHIKLMITDAGREGWADVTKERIMYREDRLPVQRVRPRFIPNSVIDQLNKHIDQLPQDVKRLIQVLQHTGRRCGEVCCLKVDCLQRDNQGDYFLRYYEFKMKKEEIIPINQKVTDAIKAQQQFTAERVETNQANYLFTHDGINPIKIEYIRSELKRLAKHCQITGPTGDIWHFQLHQFRHTLGTQMINSGMPAHIVQRYLKHSSPEMTMCYAHLHDSTMKTAYEKFQGNLVNHQGLSINVKPSEPLPEELQWLKVNVLAQTLPNGYCALPIQQGGCPHANACLSCSHFRTSAQFTEKHQHQLEEINKIIKIAKDHGWTRQVEMNEKIKTNLTKIIHTLEQEK